MNELVRCLSQAAVSLSFEKMRDPMSLRLKYLDILSGMIPPVHWVSHCSSAPARRAAQMSIP